MKKIFFIYKDYIFKSKLKLLSFAMLSMLSFVTIVSTPLITAKIIDSAVYFEGMAVFLRYVVMGAALLIVFISVMPYKYYFDLKIQTEATALLRQKIMSNIHILKYETHKKTTLGHLHQLVNDDLWSAQSLVISDLVELLTQSVYFLIVVCIVLTINVTMFWILIFIVFPLVIVSKVMIPKIQNAHQEYIKKNEDFKNLTDEVYSGTLAIKLINAETFINKKIFDVISSAKNILMRFNKYHVIHYHLFTGSFMNIGRLTLSIVGSYMLIKGQITVGTIGLVVSYFSGLWNTINFFMGFWASFKLKMISVDRIFNFLKLPIEQSEGIDTDSFNSIVIKEISFNIDDQAILSDISITINQGDKILITGDNGSGKSTLVRLLVGLITPSSGIIYYNGKDISYYNLHSLRKRINYISAEPYIFSGSLEDNFIGNDVPTDLIEKDKYLDIAKAGINLSSGEKKRIQLAAGMILDSDIYILDEPLNFVDENSKKEIVETIKRKFDTKTLIVISHDSLPFEFCQNKYFMKNGRLKKL